MAQAISPSTRTAVFAILKADPLVTSDILESIGSILSGKNPLQFTGETIEHPFSRQETAKALGISPQSVDRYAREGYLKRIHYGRSKRASGFDPASIRAMLSGRAHHYAAGGAI